MKWRGYSRAECSVELPQSKGGTIPDAQWSLMADAFRKEEIGKDTKRAAKCAAAEAERDEYKSSLSRGYGGASSRESRGGESGESEDDQAAGRAELRHRNRQRRGLEDCDCNPLSDAAGECPSPSCINILEWQRQKRQEQLTKA